MDYKKTSIQKHLHYKGKLTTKCKVPLDTKEDLSTYYSPGVAGPCLEIKDDPQKSYDLTWKNNTVAIVSDGTAVLGLGNIGGLAGLPVMEGKAILFKQFAGIDGIPIVLKTQDPDEIINIVYNISDTFGGINLEDIKAPQCFYIEEELKKKCNIPIFHDDQHGTAIVTLAGIINSLKLTNKKIEDTKIIVQGAGAAAIACIRLFVKYNAKNIITFDSKGAIYPGRENLNKYKEEIAKYNISNFKGSLHQSMEDADIFIGLSGQANSINAENIKTMANKPIIFATSNPDPEITPQEAKKGGTYIIATGRSDYPNQVNNVLAFPGIFKGALEGRITQITDEHKIKAAETIASCVPKPTPEQIIPSPFDSKVVELVSQAIKNVG